MKDVFLKTFPKSHHNHHNHMACYGHLDVFLQVVKVDLLRRRGHKWKNTKVLRPLVFPLDCWDVLFFFGGLDVFGGETHHKPPQTSIKNTNLLDNG